MAEVRDASGAVATIMSADDFMKHTIDDPAEYWRGSDPGESARLAADATRGTQGNVEQAQAQIQADQNKQKSGGGLSAFTSILSLFGG